MVPERSTASPLELDGRANSSPNVDRICKPWPHHFTKLQLALALRPRLIAKVQADVKRRQSGKPVQTPATRVAFRALEIGMTTHRRNVVLPIR